MPRDLDPTSHRRRRARGRALPVALAFAQLACDRSAASPAPSEPSPPAASQSAVPRPSAVASASNTPSTAPAGDAPPARLACLARLYGGVVERRGDGHVLRVGPAAASRSLPWDDGRAKSADARLDDPDLEDMLATPYPTGPIAPPRAGEDPGRARVTELFEATYGASAKQVQGALVAWKFRGKTLWVHSRAHAAFVRVGDRLERAIDADPTLAPFFDGMGGTFNWRPIAGTNRPSAHSFGISLDLNPKRSAYWRDDHPPRWRNAIPQVIVDAFEAERFAWGGRWAHYDTMHFEWRPELFECR